VTNKPVLVVIAGPNGAGKTEFTRTALRHEWLAGCEYVNPDEIANDVFGDWNDEKAVLAAAQQAEKIRHKCLTNRLPLAFETVFSTQEKLDFVEKAKEAGYFVRLFFIGTDTPQINAARIAKRVERGGHAVPLPKVIDRYYRSCNYLTQALPMMDRGYVYDNSVENAEPVLQFRTVGERVEKTYARDHEWANSVRKTVLANADVSARPAAAQRELPESSHATTITVVSL